MLFWMILASSLLLLVTTSLALLYLTLTVVTVQGQSMSPTLEHGDRVVVWKFWPTRWLRRGNIVLIRPREESADNVPLLIKRIIGLPGETLVTSPETSPEYLRSSQLAAYEFQGRRIWQIPPGYLFVQGDNRRVSVDSFFWGPISFRQVIGVMLRKLAHRDNISEPEPIQVFGRGPRVGQPTPPFTAETLDGAIITHTSYAGHPVVFLFICPCQLCWDLVADNETLALKAAQSQVQFVLVSGADAAQTYPFVTSLATSLPVLVAPHSSNPFLRDYDISSVPYFCSVDAQGIVQATGFPDLRRGKWKVLAESWERPVSESSVDATVLAVGGDTTKMGSSASMAHPDQPLGQSRS